MNSSAAGMPRATPNAGGSTTRERAEELGVPRRREESDDAAVGVTDEMRARLEKRVEPDRFVLEVDVRDVGPGRKAAPVGRDDLETVGERPLGAPGQVRADHGTVN